MVRTNSTPGPTHPVSSPQPTAWEAAWMLHMAGSQVLLHRGAVLADNQALEPSLNEALHANCLPLLCPSPKHNANPRARKGTFLGCTPARRKEWPSATSKSSLMTSQAPFYQGPDLVWSSSTSGAQGFHTQPLPHPWGDASDKLLRLHSTPGLWSWLPGFRGNTISITCKTHKLTQYLLQQ